MTAPRLVRALAALGLPFALAAAASVVACSSPTSNELFAKNGISSGAAANQGGSSPAGAGTGSVTSHAQNDGGGSEALGGSTTGGSATAGGSGGSDPTSSAGSSGSGGQAVEKPVPVIESCDMLDGAVTNEQNGHCYRVNSENLTFAAARDACHGAGGYLLTVSSDEENDYARDLHDGEHWLGAWDGLPDTVPGVGPYAWVNQEEWEYTDWREGQPNVFETDCPDGSNGNANDCFEHCAYQADEGDWIDRSCWHTIVSICEWEPKAPLSR